MSHTTGRARRAPLRGDPCEHSEREHAMSSTCMVPGCECDGAPRLTVRTWLLGYGDGSYHRTSPTLLARRIWHRLTGVQRGCSCSRCFNHPRRHVPAREVYDDRVRLAELEKRVRDLERSISGGIENVILYRRQLSDGREVTVAQMIFSRRICIGDGLLTYDDGWCYPNGLGAAFVIAAAEAWDGTGDPPDGWIKQISTGRRREGGDPSRETTAR